MAGEQQKQKQKHLYFVKGSDVEVCSEDDGLEGAWFEANLLESLNFSLESSYSEKKTEILVQYKTLVTEGDAPRPLREHVSLSMLRPPPPSPPLTNQSFGLNDVVDAFCNDAWWTGLINDVLGDSRYSVLFQKPPDQQPFFNSQLRRHMNWVGGDWIPSPKRGIEDFIFNVGSTVEVRLSDEGFKDVWFPANILEVAEDSLYVVRYHNPKNGDVSGHLTKTINANNIRPHPPRMSNYNFSLLEVVDAFFDAAWWSGMITSVLPDNNYVVLCRHSNKENEFINTNLRMHVEWMDGKWINCLQDLVWTGAPEHENHGNNSSNGKENVSNSDKSLSFKENEIQKSRTGKKMKFSKGSNGKRISSHSSSRKKLKTNSSNKYDTLIKKENSEEHTLSRNIWKIKVPFEAISEQEAIVMEKKPSVTDVDNASTDSFMVHPSSGGSVQSLEGSENMEMKKETVNKGINKSKLSEIVSENLGSEDTEVGLSIPNHLDHKLKGTSIHESCNDSSTETELSPNLLNDNNDTSGKMKKKRGRPQKHFKKPLDSDDVIGTELPEKSGQGNEGSTTVEEIPMNSGLCTGAAETHTKTCNSSILKESPVWKTVEAMEPFIKLPQNPHFLPLRKYNIECREGMAIGSMITFANLIKYISKLRIGDSRSSFNLKLEALSEIEQHGFDVGSAWICLNSMLAIKDRSEHRVLICEEGRTELDMCYKRRAEMEKEVEEVNKMMEELKERQAVLGSIDAMNSEISSRATRVKEMTEEIDNDGMEFEKLGKNLLPS